MSDLLDLSTLAHTLLHALWIGAAIPLLAWGVLAVLPARRARWRHAVATGGVFAVVGLAAATHGVLAADAAHRPEAPPLTWSADAWSADAAVAAAEPADRGPGAAISATVRGAAATTSAARGGGVPWRPILCGLWAVGVAVSLSRTVNGVRRARRLQRAASPAPAWLQERADRLRRRLGSARGVAVKLLDAHAQPVCVGLLHPVVLLPASVVAGDPGALRFVLAHELAHARGLHPLVAVATEVAASLLFFHPGVRWLAAQAAVEREAVADAGAARACGDDPAAAAAALGRATEGRARWATPVPAAVLALCPPRGGGVLGRMHRLLTPAAAPAGPGPRGVLPVLLAAAVALAVIHRGAEAVAGALLSPGEFVERAAEATGDTLPVFPSDAPQTAAIRGTLHLANGESPTGPLRIDSRVKNGSASYSKGHASVPASSGLARFEADRLTPGSATLMFGGEGFAPTQVGPLLLEPGQQIDGVRVELAEGFASSLVVVDAGGEPVAGFDLKLGARLGDSHVGLPTERTDAEGRVRLPHTAADARMSVTVEADGFQTVRAEWTPTPGHEERIVLPDAVPSGGRVVDALTGEPIANADVRVVRGFGVSSGTLPGAWERSRTPPEAVTDADGRFTLEALVPGHTGCLWVARPDRAALVASGLIAGETDWELKLTSAYEPVVEVRNAGLLEEGKRSIRWWQMARIADHQSSSLSGERIALPAGEGPHRVAIPGPLLDAPLEVRIGGELFTFDDPRSGPLIAELRGALPTRQVRVRLVPPAGWPAATGSVRLSTPRQDQERGEAISLNLDAGEARFDVDLGVTGGAGGEFRLTDLQVPGYRLAADPGHESIGVPAGEGPFLYEVMLLPAGTARGRVLDPRGRPLAAASGSVRILGQPSESDAPGYANPSDFMNLTVGPDGRFSVSGLPLGVPLRLEADARGRETRVFGEPFELTREVPVFEGALVMPAGTDVTARVLGPDGRPAAGVGLRLLHRSEHSGLSGVAHEADLDGQVTFRGIHFGLPGSFSVRSEPRTAVGPDAGPRGGLLPAEAALSADGGEVTLRLEEGLVLQGRLVDDATGAGIGRADLRFFQRTAPHDHQNVITDVDGRFAIGGLSASPWQVSPGWDLGYPPGTVVEGNSRTHPPGWADRWTFTPPLTKPVEIRVVRP